MSRHTHLFYCLIALSFATHARADGDCTPDILTRLVSVVESKSTPTSVRAELKRIVPQEEAVEFFAQLSARYPDRPLRYRDVPRDGFENITVTDYGDEIPLNGLVAGAERKAKIRIRTYAERASGSTAEPTRSAEFAGRSKLEFKIDHPSVENAVHKPSIVFEDQDLELLLANRASYTRHVDEIRVRTRALQGRSGTAAGRRLNDPEVTDALIDAIGEVHRTQPNAFKLKKRITYARQSYVLPLRDPGNPSTRAATHVEVQLTSDNSVEFSGYRTGTPLPLGGLPSGSRAIELKIHPSYIAMPRALLREQAPEIADLLDRYEALTIVPGFSANKGKNSALDALIENQQGATASQLARKSPEKGLTPADDVLDAQREAVLRMSARDISETLATREPIEARIGRDPLRVARLTPAATHDLTERVIELARHRELEFEAISRVRTLTRDEEHSRKIVKAFRKFEKAARKGSVSRVWLDDQVEIFSRLRPRAEPATTQDLSTFVITRFIEREIAKFPRTGTPTEQAMRWIRQELGPAFWGDRAKKTYASFVLGAGVTVPLCLAFDLNCFQIFNRSKPASADDQQYILEEMRQIRSLLQRISSSPEGRATPEQQREVMERIESIRDRAGAGPLPDGFRLGVGSDIPLSATDASELAAWITGMMTRLENVPQVERR